ncbi:hypothetical protein LZ198_19840 [Myxococcus sp. K15C18031901]|uniref:hypothetical protein n=1 Tax=Myxococcus dinghuensis TaxID=2906761 RepID=UPI0020A7F20B|nr:hypothetical protein [Myxococcus dinghuensis]MCP3101131.1 hypothetical protein [Myxococcus dinghuensis]
MRVPAGREVLSEQEGVTVMREAPGASRFAAWAWWVTAGLLAVNLGFLLWRRRFGAEGVPETLTSLGLVVVTWAAARKAWRNTWALQWWEVGSGHFVHVIKTPFSLRREAHRVSRLVVEIHRDDDDGDHEWTLWLHGEGSKVALVRYSDEPREVEHLGLWFAQRTGVPFEREALTVTPAPLAVATDGRAG